MTDIMEQPYTPSYRAQRKSAKTKENLDKYLDYAMAKVMPLKDQLTREQFKLMVLHILTEESNKKR